jgi:adenosine deaminase
LSKQNIRYAEICIDPTIYTENGLSFEQFMNALTDGSDKVQRGWNVRLAWILVIPRSKPRKGDDVARWVANAIGRKGSIVGIGLYGPEDVQPPGQFKRPFVTAEKKGFPRVLYAGNVLGPEGVTAALDEFERVERLVDAWGIAESPETLEKLVALDIPLAVAPVRELRLGRIAQYGEYPLRRLYDDNIKLILGTGMPNLYRTTLTDEYLTLVQQDILSVEELEELTLNAIRYSFLPDEDREKLLAEFAAEYTRLRAEHLEKEVASDES